MKSITKHLLIILFLGLALTSCDKNDKEDSIVTTIFNATEIPYNENNVWTEVMNNDAQIISQNVTFSHSSNPEWNSWNGFVASRNSDATDYSAEGFYPTHQYTAITEGGKSGKGTPYLVAYWNSSESKDVSLDDASCAVTFGKDKRIFSPQQVMVTNTTYAYYTIKNGSPYSKKFADGDYFKLLIYGVKEDGSKTEPVTVLLADYTNGKSEILNDWEYVNLEALGEVCGLVFQMESSDTGTFGINTPTYFAIDRLTLKLK